MKKLIFAVIFMALFVSDSAARNNHLAQEALRGEQNFDISTVVSERDVGRCSLTENDVRTVIVNRTIPAGIIISNQAILSVNARIITLRIPSLNLCVSSIHLDISRVDALFPREINQQGANIRPVEYEVWRESVVFSRAEVDFRRGFDETLIRMVDNFLASWRQINAGAAFVRQQAPAQTSNQQPSNISPDNPNIRTVQQRLAALNLYTGAIDGIAGPATRQAIQNFQRSQQLPATGDLDRETMRRLFP